MTLNLIRFRPALMLLFRCYRCWGTQCPHHKQVEVATKAATLFNSVQQCTFLIAASVMQHTSGIILPISKLLQKKELDIFAVIELIDSVLDILRQNRSNCENVFHEIFDQVKNECEKYYAPLLMPRRCKVKFAEIIILLMTLSIFFGKPYLYRI